MTPDHATAIVREMILLRKGAVIDESIADERARNVVAALGDTVIGTPPLLLAAETIIAHHTPELSDGARFAELVEAVHQARGGG